MARMSARRRAKAFLQKRGDDLLIVAGSCSIVYGAWQLSPVAAWFVAGVALIVFGVLVGLGGKR